MASRGGNTGWIVTSVILGGLCLTSMIFAFKFYSDSNVKAQEAADAQTAVNELISGADRSEIERLREQMRAAGVNKSPFAYLSERTDAATQALAGVPSDQLVGAITSFEDTLDDATRDRLNNVRAAYSGVQVSDATQTVRGLLGVISSVENRFDAVVADSQREGEITSAVEDIASGGDAVDIVETLDPLAQAGVLREFETGSLLRVREAERDFAELSTKVDNNEGRLANSIEFYNEAQERIRADFNRIETIHKNRVGELSDENNKLQRTVLQLQDQIRQITAEIRRDSISPPDETTLVDGELATVDAAQRVVTLSIGRREKVVLDMEFGIYTDAAALRPDSSGNYPRAKAICRVTNVGETSSTARVISRNGNAQLFVGDVIANPVYDPTKIYKLLVFGDFDTNGDGFSSGFEADTVASKIREWGARVVSFPEHERMARDRQSEILLGDVDFLVLGSRPIVPPEPSPDAPDELIEAWIAENDKAQLYEVYQQRARETGVPILTYNRLRTLIND